MIAMILKEPKEFTKIWKNAIKEKVAASGKVPNLAIIQVGDLEASNRYIKHKMRDCDEVGFSYSLYKLEESISTENLIYLLRAAQEGADGVIVQLPLPAHINKDEIIAAIEPEKDVDGFRSDSKFEPCTPGGIMRYLQYIGFDLVGKNVVIIGRSDIVGKPLAKMMIDADATVTLCHSKTRNLYPHINNADLIVCAVGKPNFLNCYSIYKPVIDVGINFVDSKLIGDTFNTEGRDVTPVPGGVGLLTRCMLLENVLKAALCS